MQTTRLDLPIQGMSCAGCAARIEKALQALPGVQNAQVNFATAKATIHYDPAIITLDQFTREVEEIGDDVPLQRLTIPIGGMHCASCVASVERALQGVAGVVTARVNLASEKATVEYLPTQADAAMLRQAITEAGFEPREL